MSTYLHLTCLDHDPPLLAEDESGQHLYDLPRIRQEIADRANVAAGPRTYHPDGPPFGDYDMPAYFRAASARFLGQHPACRIGITDEYGREHPTTDGTTP